ncbi:MAG: hypothetical protein R2788_08580 [Saprospiraceae bacterium]
MNRTAVQKKIDKMPDALMDTVATLLDKLIETYEIGQQSLGDVDFTEEELEEFDRRDKEIQEDPSASISLAEFKKQMKEEYGV